MSDVVEELNKTHCPYCRKDVVLIENHVWSEHSEEHEASQRSISQIESDSP